MRRLQVLGAFLLCGIVVLYLAWPAVSPPTSSAPGIAEAQVLPASSRVPIATDSTESVDVVSALLPEMRECGFPVTHACEGLVCAVLIRWPEGPLASAKWVWDARECVARSNLYDALGEPDPLCDDMLTRMSTLSQAMFAYETPTPHWRTYCAADVAVQSSSIWTQSQQRKTGLALCDALLDKGPVFSQKHGVEVEVVVASRDLRGGHRLTRADLNTRVVLADVLENGVFLSVAPLLDRQIQVALVSGQVVSSEGLIP